MNRQIQIIADTHEPGSLEGLLWVAERVIYSTGDHIPSGMHGADRKMVDKIRAAGVKDVGPALAKAYEEDPEFRKASDADYMKTIANMATRRLAIKHKKAHILSGAGNQDFSVGAKIRDKYQGPDVFEYFDSVDADNCPMPELENWVGMHFSFDPTVYMEDRTAVLLVPHNPGYRKDKRPFEEIKGEMQEDEGVCSELDKAERVLLLSHQSIDCTAMGLPEGKRDAFTDPGNRALIETYHQAACARVGAQNVQMVHGHHHTPHKVYEFNGSKVHNMNIGDLLTVDAKTGEAKVKHVLRY